MREEINSLVEKLEKLAYNRGWDDCKEYYAAQPYSAARTDNLSATVKDLQKDLKDVKKRLSLAVKLLRHAQASPCGQDGQFDRFFQERYDAGYNDVSTEEVRDQGTLLPTHSNSVRLASVE